MGGLEGNRAGGDAANHQQPSTSTYVGPFERGDSSCSTNSSSTSWSSAHYSSAQRHHPQHSHVCQQSPPSSHLPVAMPPYPSNGVRQALQASSPSLTGSSSNDRSRTGNNSMRPSLFFCFGLLMVHSTFVTLAVFDLLLLSHSIIFTISNYLNGERAYADGGSDHQNQDKVDKSRDLDIAANNLPYSLLMPLFGVQVFWLVAAILALLSLKTIQPYWQLPYLIISGIVLFATMWLIIQTIQKLSSSATVDWALALTLSFSNVVFLIQIYFLYIKIVSIKALIRKRKSVVSTANSQPKLICSSSSKTKANLSIPTESCSHSPRDTDKNKLQEDDTYSTQSTVVISDGKDCHTPTLPIKSALKF